MENRKTIVKFCEEYLNVEKFKDYCHNGLQVEGRDEVKKIITGVSLSRKLIEKAIEKKADMIIVHHGLFKNDVGELPEIVGVVKGRLKVLLENDINLCGFHLPLDAHDKIGNNISLVREFNLGNVERLKDKEYGSIGFIGELENEMSFDNFVEMVNQRLETTSVVIRGGENKVKKVGIVSGGASPDYKFASKQGADTYICGDIREEVVRGVEEIGMNFVNGGHYNTEKMGIQNLGELLAEKFDVEVEFVDIPNEV